MLAVARNGRIEHPKKMYYNNIIFTNSFGYIGDEKGCGSNVGNACVSDVAPFDGLGMQLAMAETDENPFLRDRISSTDFFS
jgi:hypothetical protein